MASVIGTGDRGEQPRAHVAQEERDDRGAQGDAEEDRVAHARHRFAHEARLVVDRLDRDPVGQRTTEARRPRRALVDDVGRARAGEARDADADGLAARPADADGAILVALDDLGDGARRGRRRRPGDVATGISRMSASVFGCASPSTVTSCRSRSTRPTALSPIAARSAVGDVVAASGAAPRSPRGRG